MSLAGLDMMRPKTEPYPHIEQSIFVDVYDSEICPKTGDWIRYSHGVPVFVDSIRGVPLFEPISWWRRLFGGNRGGA